MTNRKLNGDNFSEDFVLYQFNNGVIIDLSLIVSVSPFITLSNNLSRYDITFKGCESNMQIKLEEYDAFINSWLAYKNSQNIGNHLSYIAFQLENLCNEIRNR